MAIVTTKDAHGQMIEVTVTEEIYEFWEKARIADETQARYDRASRVKEALTDYHSNILLHPEDDMSVAVENSMLIEQMLTAVGRLSDFEQLLIKKRFYEKLPHAVIAQELGVPRSTVQYKIKHAIARISEEMRI